MFEREIRLIGEDNFNKIKSKIVAVIGLGGVGGYAVEALVRSGIEKIIIVDYDVVDVTNLNRQIISLQENIGKNKTEITKERIKSINPNCSITVLNKKLDLTNIASLFNHKIDYVVDACDSLNVKQQLILECINRNIKQISCMGTGNKLNPELLKITDIRKTSYDPLAKKIRKFVVDNKIKNKIMVVSSTEQPKKTGNGVISSISYVPSVAGLLCASYVINDIINEK